jgi:hypothetical protein
VSSHGRRDKWTRNYGCESTWGDKTCRHPQKLFWKQRVENNGAPSRNVSLRSTSKLKGRGRKSAPTPTNNQIEIAEQLIDWIQNVNSISTSECSERLKCDPRTQANQKSNIFLFFSDRGGITNSKSTTRRPDKHRTKQMYRLHLVEQASKQRNKIT